MASTKIDTRSHAELMASNKAAKKAAEEDKSRAVEAARAAQGAAVQACDEACKQADADLAAEMDRRSKAIVADLYSEAAPIFAKLGQEPTRTLAGQALAVWQKYDARCRDQLGEGLHSWHVGFLTSGSADCFKAAGVAEACEAFARATTAGMAQAAFTLVEQAVVRQGRPAEGAFYREHASYLMAARAEEAARVAHQAKFGKGHHLAGPVPVPKAPVQVALGGLESLPS